MEQPLSEVERDKLYPCSLESLGDIQGEAKETYHQEKHEESLKYVIRFKPGYHQIEISPQFECESERDSEFEQTETCRVLCSSVTYDGYNSDIQQIDEKFKRSYLLRTFRSQHCSFKARILG